MRSILKMKSVAWGALVLVVVWLGFIIGTPAPWWTYKIGRASCRERV